MTNQPPKLKSKSYLWLWLVLGIAVVIAVITGLGIYVAQKIDESGITEPFDKKFGDQHLKTAVALIELHKVRNGNYPDSLTDLEYTGDWDIMAIASVTYIPSEDRQSYYVEVHRGWMGKPDLKMPDGFWTGTGYDPELKPATKLK